MSETAPRPRLTALIFMGVSGSGKSTAAAHVAERLNWPMIEGDEMHPQANIDKMSQGIPLTDEDRGPWLTVIAAHIDDWRRDGVQGIITCSSLKRAYRDILRSGHDDVRFVYLKGSYDLLLGRMQHRKGHYMPASLLRSQFDTLEEPGLDEAIVVDLALSEEAIVTDTLTQLHLG